jgi:hypothetical protein
MLAVWAGPGLRPLAGRVATGRYAEAATLWAAWEALSMQEQPMETAPRVSRQRQAMRETRQVLGADRVRAPKNAARR